ncbi:MAG: hypothetical protein K5879_08175 [Lachnospiraceae bacterium]|nr:hypothetical protein [Lachnospiraceae bacterium]
MKKMLVSLCIISTVLFLVGCGTDEVSQKVMDDIDSIGEVTLDDAALISKITSSYATLTDSQKNQVKNYKKLLDAQDKLEELQAEAGGQLKENLKKAVNEMYTSAVMCEDIIKDVDRMWDVDIFYVNSVYESDSTFEVTSSVFPSMGGVTLNTVKETRKKVKDIENNHSELLKEATALTNWPDDMSEEKKAWDEYYSAYLDYYELATNPSGNHINYVSDANDKSSAFLNAYKKITPYLE